MRPRGWRRAAVGMLAGLSVVSVGIFMGCEKVGNGQQGAPSSSPQRSGPSTVAQITDVAGIRLSADDGSLVANGSSSTIITAILLDSRRRPAPDGLVVNFTTDRGRFTTAGAKSAVATTRDGTGTVLVPFISEKDVVGTATIVANVKGVSQSLQVALTGPGDPLRVILTADATTISLAGATGITAQVLDDDGNNVADGTAVFFTTSLSGTGVTPSATTVGGVATAIFAAGTSAGVATVSATAGLVSAVISITILPGSAGSLEFVKAEPQVIGVRGSQLTQKSTITFLVRDQNGNPVADGTPVVFTLVSGVGGDEMVGPTTAGTLAGQAATVLTGGTVSGAVRVGASVVVGGVTLRSSSTNVIITGGPPSGTHIGVAPQFVNIAGQVTFGIVCPLEATVGDRFGNPVPPGTAVAFFTNGGVIDQSRGFTDDLGNAPSRIKTGNPIPHVGGFLNPLDPRTGVVSIIAVTQGEETFIDANGNGEFDGPQEFDATDPALDTAEPFIDHVTLCNGQPFPVPCPPDHVTPPLLSGNNLFDPTNRFELFIDGNGNRQWDTPNGVWDGNKAIFSRTTVLFTGPTVLTVERCDSCVPRTNCRAPGGFNISNGSSDGPYCIVVSDPSGHPLVSGTQLSVKASVGAIVGTDSLIFPDTRRGGPGSTLFTFAIADEDTQDIQPKSTSVTVTVTSPPSSTCPGGNGNAQVGFTGTIN